MGLRFISCGFLLLHFHFIMRLESTGWLPYLVSIPLIILGLLYAYQETHKKEYLMFVSISVMLMIISFMGDVRILFLLLQTCLCGMIMAFLIKQYPHYIGKKSIIIWLLVYLISGVLRSYFIFNWNSELYNNCSIINIFSIMTLIWHILKIRKIVEANEFIPREKKPFPRYVCIIIFVISILTVGLTIMPITKHLNREGLQYKFYELSNEIIDKQYIVETLTRTQSNYINTIQFLDGIEFIQDIHPTNIEIQFNSSYSLLANESQKNNNKYYFMFKNNTWVDQDFRWKTSCSVTVDSEDFPTQINHVEIPKYSYKDSYISIDQCFIKDNIVFMNPRIEIFDKKIIYNVEILNNNGEIIASSKTSEKLSYYKDFVTIYNENIPQSINPRGQGPYTTRITYFDQGNLTVKEYPLTLNEDYL